MKRFTQFCREQREAELLETINGLSVIKATDFGEFYLNEGYAPFLGALTNVISADDMQDYAGRIHSQSKLASDKYKMPYVHRSNLTVKDESGKTFDLDKLKKDITTRPTSLLKQNEKIKHTGGATQIVYNLGLPALRGLAVNEKTGEFVIVNTCPGAGACKIYCYAMKGGYVQYAAPSMSASRVLNFLLNDPDGFSAMLTKELTNAEKSATKKSATIIFRWHDAGDFFSPQYMELAFDLARRFPNIQFYAYTKVAAVANSSTKPSNFLFNFSQGAQPSQEKLINPTSTKQAMVVPKELLGDLIKKVPGAWTITDVEEAKERLAKHYHLNPKVILTYPEMLKTPQGPSLTYSVIVIPGDGDLSATRSDVKNTLLYIH